MPKIELDYDPHGIWIVRIKGQSRIGEGRGWLISTALIKAVLEYWNGGRNDARY